MGKSLDIRVQALERQALLRTGLSRSQVRPVRDYYEYLQNLDEPYEVPYEFAHRADMELLAGKRRKATKKPITSHALGAEIDYLEITKGLRSREHDGLDSLQCGIIRLHDWPEEETGLALAELPEMNESEEEQVRSYLVRMAAGRYLDTFREAFGPGPLAPHFSGLDIESAVPETFDKLTPNKLTSSKLKKLYADNIRIILGTGSLESSYLALNAKDVDRPNNNREVFADIRLVRQNTSLAELQVRFSALEQAVHEGNHDAYGKTLHEHAAFLRRMQRAEQQEGIHSLSPTDRIQELYKSLVLSNQQLLFLGRTARIRHTSVQSALRQRSELGVLHVLRTLQECAQQQALFLTVYHLTDLPPEKPGRNNLYAIFRAANACELHDNMRATAADYVRTAEGARLQGTKGRGRLSTFNGTIARLTEIDAKNPATVRAYQENYLQQLQDALLVGAYASHNLAMLNANVPYANLFLFRGLTSKLPSLVEVEG